MGESARGRRCGVGILSVEGVKSGQGRVVRKPFSSTKCSARSVRRSAMTCALRASGKTLVQSLKARLVVMQVERRYANPVYDAETRSLMRERIKELELPA